MTTISPVLKTTEGNATYLRVSSRAFIAPYTISYYESDAVARNSGKDKKELWVYGYDYSQKNVTFEEAFSKLKNDEHRAAFFELSEMIVADLNSRICSIESDIVGFKNSLISDSIGFDSYHDVYLSFKQKSIELAGLFAFRAMFVSEYNKFTSRLNNRKAVEI